MQRNDPLPPPLSSIPAPMTVIDRQGLRAALRLVLTPAEADVVAAKLPEGGDLEDLRSITREAIGRARVERWLEHLPWRDGATDGRLLGPASNAGPEAAVALALAVGLRLDGRDLADVLDARIERVGEWLVEGRRGLDPQMPDPCRKTAWLVGRYEDRSLDPDERVELLTHLNRCSTCQEVVERSRDVDGQVVAEVARLQTELPPAAGATMPRLERLRRGALVAGVVMVLTLVSLIGGTVASRLIDGGDDPVPLLTAQEPEPYDGWLVLASGDGSVQARHLATGETRRIFDTDDPIGGVSASVLLSPAGTRLMSYYGEYFGTPRSRVVVNALDGSEIGRVEWGGDDLIHHPTGWIDERRILVRVFPIDQPGQGPETFAHRFENESGLLVIDVETGEQRELLMGNIAFGVPAPDGRHIALARITDPALIATAENSFTIEVWEIADDGTAQGPIATIPDWTSLGGEMIWSGDGTRLFVTQVVRDTPSGEQGTRNILPHQLIAIGLDGTITTLADATSDSAIYPVSATSDGSTVVYLRFEASSTVRSTAYWSVDVNGGEPKALSEAISPAYGGSGVVWSPDGSALLIGEVTVPYLEPGDDRWSRWGPSATDVIAIGPDGQRTLLLTTYAVGQRMLGWLADDALPDVNASRSAITVSEPEPVSGVPHDTRLDSKSAASRDGMFVTLDDTSIGSPLVWETTGTDTQRLRGSIEDAIWLPGSRGLLSVSGGREQSRSSSRLSVLASTNPYAPLALEPLQFDPAGLDGDRSRRYAAPRVAPDGLHTSFFIVDESGGVELWIANAVSGIERVTSWRLPGNRIIEPPLEARWVDDRTLVFVEPRDWTSGMPETAALRRVTVATDGSLIAEDVIEIIARGDDKGIALHEIAASSNGQEISWRIRHYTEWSASDGRFDTIHLAPTADLSRDVELTRGSAGNGLAWSSDSRLLLVGIDRDVMLANPTNLSTEIISDGMRAEHPLWVGDDEIWFSVDDGIVASVMRVRVN